MDAPNNDGGNSTTTYTYDALDRLVQVQDARGLQTQYAYNGRHQVTRVTHPQDPGRAQHPNDSGAVTNYVATTYDDQGNVTSVTDECSHTSRMTYDYYRRPVLTQDGLGHCVFLSYECRNRNGAVVANPYTHTRTGWAERMSPSYANGARYKHSFRAYDGFLRLVTQVDGLGGTDGNWPNVVNGGDAARTDWTYDADGNLTAVTDPYTPGGSPARTTAYAVDSRGRRISLTLPADGQYDRTTTYDYDGAGNLTYEHRPGGTRFYYAYDQMNRRFWTQDPRDHVTQTRFGYENGGTNMTTTDANNNVYVAHTDGLGRPISMVYPGGGQESWHHDGVGNLDRFTNRAGQVQTLTYNNRNALETTSWNANGRSTWNGYYADGLPQWKTVDAGSYQTSLSYWFDAAGHATYEHQSPDTNVNFINAASSYDDDNTRGQLTYPGGDTVAPRYNDRLQPSTVGFDGGTLCTYNWSVDGTLSTRSLENGTSTWHNVDAGRRLASLIHYRGGDMSNLVTGFDYGYDTLTRRTWGKKREDGRGDFNVYQDDDQLYFAHMEAYNVDTGNPSGDRRADSYTYDAAGNRSQSNNSGVVTNYSPDALNRYASVNNQAVGYDANGSLNFDPLSGSQYQYDADNRLTRAYDPQTGVVTNFGYDGLGRCVWRQAGDGGPKTYLYYDGTDLIEERDQGGNRLNRYVHGGGVDQPLAMVTAQNTRLYYHQDVNKNVVALTDANGNTVERYSYDVFGQPYVLDGGGGYTRGDQSAYGNRFLFTGREYLQGLKLYDYRARAYSPSLGRFLQSDPIGFGGGNHLYRYCDNNPTNASDPSGTDVTLSQHSVYVLGQHTFLTITPSNLAVANAVGNSNLDPFTLSGQPDQDTPPYGNLEATKDTDQKYIGNPGISLPPPAGMTQSQFELAIIAAFKSFQNNTYPYSPIIIGRTYNSNGFTVALLNAVGLDGKKILSKLPGLLHPGIGYPPKLGKVPVPSNSNAGNVEAGNSTNSGNTPGLSATGGSLGGTGGPRYGLVIDANGVSVTDFGPPSGGGGNSPFRIPVVFVY